MIRHGASEDDAERGAADAVKKSKDAAERWAKRCEEIVDEYLKEYLPQKDIAQRHRVKTQLVNDLVYERKNNPEKHRLEKEKEKLAKQ